MSTETNIREEKWKEGDIAVLLGNSLNITEAIEGYS